MHNESMAEQIIDGSAESVNGNGPEIFEPGETGIAFTKDETGVKFGIRLSTKQLRIGTAILVGTAVAKAVAKKVIENADAAKDVAKTVAEEVAA
jgi:hypothetical protein